MSPLTELLSDDELPAAAGDFVAAAALVAGRDASAAAHLLHRSLALVPADSRARLPLVLSLLPLATWGGRPRQAEALARSLLDEAAGTDTVRIRIELAHALGLQDRWSESVAVWDGLLGEPLVDRATTNLVRAERAAALAFARDVGVAADEARAALDDAAGHTSAEFAALLALATCAFFEARLGAALETVERLVALADSTRDQEVLRRNPHLVHGVCLAAAGRPDDARTALGRAERLARDTGALWALPGVHWGLANLDFKQGRWDDAIGHFEEGLRVCDAAEPTWEYASLLGSYAVVQARRAGLREAEGLLDRMAVVDELTHGDRAWRALAGALVAEARGNPADALAQLAQTWREARALAVTLSVAGILPDLLRLAVARGEVGLAGEIDRDFRSLVEATPEPGPMGVAADHCTGVATQSAAHLERAISGYGRWRHVPHEALAWEELAVVRAAGDHPRKALGALREALMRYDAADATVDARRARARLRAYGVLAPSGGSGAAVPGPLGSLTPAERAVADLVAEGLRNQEIAARLFVSVQTVQTHLKSVFRKLGATARSQVVVEVLRERSPEPRRRPGGNGSFSR